MILNSKLRRNLIIICVIAELLVILFMLLHKDPKVKIYVAKEDIEAFTLIKEDMLEEREMDKDSAESIYPLYAKSMDELVGCITRDKIPAGHVMELQGRDLVMGDELADALDKDGTVNNRYFLDTDSRLITISVDAVGSLNYKIKKGDEVDVIFTPEDNGGNAPFSNVILEGVYVFDVENVITETDSVINKKQNITLITSEQDAVALVAANRNGYLNLALNPPNPVRDYIHAVRVSDFLPSVMESKGETLDYIKYFVKATDMTSTNREKILSALADEVGRDALREIILESDLDNALMSEILTMLED